MVEKIKAIFRMLKIRGLVSRCCIVFQIYDPWNRKMVEDIGDLFGVGYFSIYDKTGDSMLYYISKIEDMSRMREYLESVNRNVTKLFYYNDSILGVEIDVITDKA